VEALNCHKEFHFSYPDSHEDQRRIAEEYREKSTANFAICAGAIDGILIWTRKPSGADCEKLQLGQRKFFCSRKNKFGLNCQAVCDARGRFLDLSICLGGASSDCLAFERSALYKRLEEGLLAEGLCLFGDNAYLNTSYMATPYTNQHSGARDNYNFYHSQLRIKIECAFGMFTERWAILRSAIPMNIRINKTISLVSALAKLHNFCIDMEEGSAGRLVARDFVSLISNPDGYVPLLGNTQLPVALSG
jgi:DDE superfamily endonuclease